MTNSNVNLPGRLGNPNASLDEDSRTDPRIIQALAAVGGFADAVEPIGSDAAYEDCLAYCMAFEETAALANPILRAAMPILDSITSSTETITDADDNEINLHIHRPKSSDGRLPCIVHTHGGGMVLMTAEDPPFVRWRDSLADMGMVVIGVEFRNGGGRLGNHPFPAGLNDCAEALQWTYTNRERLGISSIVISGESGGGNLSLATTLKAKQEGWLNQIDGVYAMCPYISGCYANPSEQLLSLYENNGYMMDCAMMAALVKVYDPSNNNSSNPLAWPYHAKPEDLAGLPPHVISVNELDPLRDEGLGYYRKLLGAGVPTVARTVNGTPHAGDQIFPDIIPEVYQETIRSIYGFATSL